MNKPKRVLSAEFKARVALEALQEKKTIAQIAAQYEVQSSQVSAWKKQFLENSAKLFAQNQVEVDSRSEEKLKEELYKQIGQLRVENEWLKKKSAQFLGQKFA